MIFTNILYYVAFLFWIVNIIVFIVLAIKCRNALNWGYLLLIPASSSALIYYTPQNIDSRLLVSMLLVQFIILSMMIEDYRKVKK